MKIPQRDLRDLFNQGQYMARAERGELIPCLKSVTARKVGGNLDGMCGYTVGYDDRATGVRVFLVQYFMSDDGEIGASGLEDPKWLHHHGVAYIPLETLPPW